MSIISNIINLESLLDLSARLNETDNEDFILNSAILSLMGKLRIFRACAFIESDGLLLPKVCKGKSKLEPIESFDIDSIKILNNETFAGSNDIKYILPIKYKDKMIGIIALGNRLSDSELSEEEKNYAKLVSQIVANAIQNARNHHSLIEEKQKTESRNQLLSTLFELARDFSSLLSRNQILKMLSLHLMGQLMINKYAVFLINQDAKFELIINKFDESLECCELDFDDISPIVKNIVDSCCPIELKNRFPEAEIISPMIVQGSTRGLLLVGKSLTGKVFNDLDFQFISSLGNTAISALENDRLFQEEIEKKKIEGELELALEIQRNLLPNTIPEIDGFDINGASIPSRHVGGDYFDFIKLNSTQTLIAIADVSGKGMPAALLMANVQAALRVLTPLNLPLTELVLKLNDIVYLNTSPDRFVTFFCGILDSNDSSFKFINAGHNYPIFLRSNNEVIQLKDGGIILGILDIPIPYEIGEINFNIGDALLMYTDGFSEAQDIHGKEYGEESLTEFFIANKQLSSTDFMMEMVNEIKNYSDGFYQNDDLTLVVIKKIS